MKKENILPISEKVENGYFEFINYSDARKQDFVTPTKKSKYETKKEYVSRQNATNILRSQNLIITDELINTYLTFLESTEELEKPIKIYTSVIDYITEEKAHEKFTIAIIKSIVGSARKVVDKDGNEKTRSHFCFNACYEIVKSGYTDPILDDIKQEVFITLFELIQENHLRLENNQLVFDTYINTKGNETSYFLHLFKTVEKYLYNQKQKITKIESYNLSDYDDIGKDENENEKRKAYTTYSFFASRLVDSKLENIATYEYVKTLFKHLKTKYPKHFSKMCTIVECLYYGYSQTQIEKLTQGEISQRQIWYLLPIIREEFKKLDLHVTISTDKTRKEIDRKYNPLMYCKVVSSNGNTYYINREKPCENLNTNIIKNNNICIAPYPTYTENIYYTPISHVGEIEKVLKEIEKKRKLKEEEEKEIKHTSNFTHIYFTNEKLFKVYMSNEEIYTYKLHRQTDEKVLKYCRKYGYEMK